MDVASNFMTTITSSRHKTKFYLTVILGTLFFLVLATVLLFIYFDQRELGNTKPKTALMPFFSIAVYFMAFYTVYRYYRNAPNIRVDNQLISFNDETYSLSDLQHIELTGKRNFPYLFSFQMEAATLRFKDGQTKYIFDDMYENAWQLKSYLNQVIVDKKSFAEQDTQLIEKSELESEWYNTFKDNPFTSLRGISLWGLIGFFAFMQLTKGKTPSTGGWIFLIVFSTFWFVFHSWLMHYFKVSQTLFVVKNHNMVWKTKAYRLSDIKEIVFETQGKMPNCLRVITKDFRNKLYPAGTLKDKTWLELKDKLESQNIKVRNECI
jgi:hypothetical protein